jgi:tRNA-specific 2-thiouridylase
MSGPLVAVGMSGGVDSSVVAALLQQQGYRVVGLFMKNWEETDEDGVCPAALDYEDVRAVCSQLGITCYAFNFSRQYWDNVFEHFLAELRAGRTPNPDILCNREIKFKVLLDKARDLGAEYLATGHYARVGTAGDDYQLLRGSDLSKDQSYFLYTLTADLLPQILFPIGHLYKREVRALAQQYALATSAKKESMGICFIGKRDFKEFVSRYIAYHPGPMVTPEGIVVGQHHGVAYYTIGQRHGLAIGGPGEPWFVADKRVETNELVVVQGSDHPALFRQEMLAADLSWVDSRSIPEGAWRCTAKVRYRQVDQPCTVTVREEKAYLHFDTPQRAVTPGQAVVFYRDDICLGGGTLLNSEQAATS